MDLLQLDAELAKDENGVVILINKKDGSPFLADDGSKCSMTVVGSESKRYREARDKNTRRALRTRRNKLEAEDVLRNRVELAAAAVIDWNGFEIGGKAAPCTPENVQRLLTAYFILEQVEEGIEQHADFFVKQSANSSK